ncbi:MAG: hypothetical protein ABL973_09020 [Micropepsaceae bacterium]
MGGNPGPLVAAEMAAGVAGAEGASAPFSDSRTQACFQIVAETSVGTGCIDRLRQRPDRIDVQKLQT